MYIIYRQPKITNTKVKFGKQTFTMTKIPKNENVVRYKILYQEIVKLMETLVINIKIIKDYPANDASAALLKVKSETKLNKCLFLMDI